MRGLQTVPGESAEDRTRGDGTITLAGNDQRNDRSTDAVQVCNALVDIDDFRLCARSNPRTGR